MRDPVPPVVDSFTMLQRRRASAPLMKTASEISAAGPDAAEEPAGDSGPPWRNIARITWPAVAAIALLLLVNLLSLRISDALQTGLANGNRVVKAQKTAVIHLLRHIETGDPAHLTRFRSELAGAILAGRSREALQAEDFDGVRRLMADMGLPARDAETRIFLYRLASRLEQFRKVLQHWAEADALMARLERIAAQSAVLHASGPAADERKQDLTRELLAVDQRITETTNLLNAGIVDSARWFRGVERTTVILVAAALLAFTLVVAGNGVARLTRARTALRRAGERYELAVAAANDGLWDWDVVSQDFLWTPRLRELLGYGVDDDFAGRVGLRGLLHPEDARTAVDDMQAHLRGETPRYDIHTRLRCRDGSYRWFRIRGSAIRDPQGRPQRVLGTLTDVHARVLAEQAQEEAIRQREQAAAELELALNASMVALWGYEPATGRILHARRWNALLGHSEMPADVAQWRQLVHPDDQQHRANDLQRHFTGEVPYAESEYRMRHAAGHWVWVRSRGRATRRDADGNVLEFADAVMNLSEQMAARELQRRQSEFLQAMVEGIDTGIMLSSEERITYVNASLCRMFGYEKERLIGAHVAEFAASPEAAEGIMARRRAALTGAELPLALTEIRNVQGQSVKIIAAVSHVKWNGVSHFVSTVTPVGDLDRTEARLKSAQVKFERVLLGHLEAQQAQIAHELHDSIGSALAGLSLLIGIAKTAAASGGADAVLDRCQQQVQAAVETARGLARGIMPVDEQPGALLHALDQFVHDLRSSKGVHATLEAKGNVEDMPPAAANHVYRIVQEAVSNALRHGKATVIRIAIEDTPRARTVVVEDNGSGLPPAWARTGKGGIGLRSMRARADALGGTLRFGTAAGGGTQVTLRLVRTAVQGVEVVAK